MKIRLTEKTKEWIAEVSKREGTEFPVDVDGIIEATQDFLGSAILVVHDQNDLPIFFSEEYYIIVED